MVTGDSTFPFALLRKTLEKDIATILHGTTQPSFRAKRWVDEPINESSVGPLGQLMDFFQGQKPEGGSERQAGALTAMRVEAFGTARAGYSGQEPFCAERHRRTAQASRPQTLRFRMRRTMGRMIALGVTTSRIRSVSTERRYGPLGGNVPDDLCADSRAGGALAHHGDRLCGDRKPRRRLDAGRQPTCCERGRPTSRRLSQDS